jgi:hypothetical protein
MSDVNPYQSTDRKSAKKSSLISFGSTQRVRSKSGTPSYADIITNAILSSSENRLSLAEIYDWMVKNVNGLEDQRHLHSSKGWKNAVRHTLSINQRFKKITRIGRPGWWTVEWPSTDHRCEATVNDDANWTEGIVPFNPDDSLFADKFRVRSGSEPSRFLSHFPHIAANSREYGASAPVSPSPYHNDGFQGVQHIQVWRDDGTLGVVSVPCPMKCRNTLCNDASTQTDKVDLEKRLDNGALHIEDCAHSNPDCVKNSVSTEAHLDNTCAHSRPQYEYNNSCAHSRAQNGNSGIHSRTQYNSCARYDKTKSFDNKSNILPTFKNRDDSLEFAPSLTNSPYHMLTTIVDNDWISSSYDNVILSNWFQNTA